MHANHNHYCMLIIIYKLCWCSDESRWRHRAIDRYGGGWVEAQRAIVSRHKCNILIKVPRVMMTVYLSSFNDPEYPN